MWPTLFELRRYIDYILATTYKKREREKVTMEDGRK